MSRPTGSSNDRNSKASERKPDSGADRNKRDHGDEEGEDEGGAPTEGDYRGLKDNQKPVD